MKDALKFTCPVCGASPEQGCNMQTAVMDLGKLKSIVHKEREALASQSNSKESK